MLYCSYATIYFCGVSDLVLIFFFFLQAWVVSGSPQSTLCGCRQGSSNGSPNGPSQVSNPAATWDLLYAAAGEVARMRTSEEMQSLNHGRGGLFGPPRKLQPSPITVPVKNNSNSDVGIFSRQTLSHQQLQVRSRIHTFYALVSVLIRNHSFLFLSIIDGSFV